MRRALKEAGPRAIDGRSAAGRALAEFKADITSALGGDLSPQKSALLEVAATTWLLLSSVDGWLLEQRSLVNRRRRELVPVVQQRAALVKTLRDLLGDLGLDRVAKRAESVQDWLASAGEGQGQGSDESEAQEASGAHSAAASEAMP